MFSSNDKPTAEGFALLQWIARVGPVTAEAVAVREGCTVSSARGRLLSGERAGLIARSRLLDRTPALHTITVRGFGALGEAGRAPFRVSPANATHALACARVLATLEPAYPDHEVVGEGELRRREGERGTILASARLGSDPEGRPLLHRPDLVLWPGANDGSLPVAVEVELTVKAPRRLTGICRAWARTDCVAGVLYLAAPAVLRPLARALEQALASDRVIVLELTPDGGARAIERTIPGDA